MVMQNNTVALEDAWAAFLKKKQKTKITITVYDPGIMLLGIYPNESKTCPYQNLCMNILSLFLSAPKWKQPRCLLQKRTELMM